MRDTGFIYIYKTSSSTSPVESFDANDSRVTISTTTLTNDTVTINPTITLEQDEEYYVIISSTYFKDLENNYYSGISNAGTWKFTTESSQIQSWIPSHKYLTSSNHYNVSISHSSFLSIGGNDYYGWQAFNGLEHPGWAPDGTNFDTNGELATSRDLFNNGIENIGGPWLKIDFGARCLITKVGIQQWNMEYMKEWSLWSSDDDWTWTQRLQHTAPHSNGQPVGPDGRYYTMGGYNSIIQFPLASPAAGRYWVIHITKTSGQYVQLRQVIYS